MINKETIICKFCGKEISKEKFRLHLKRKHIDCFNTIIDLTIYVINLVENINYEDINNILKEYENNSTLSIEDKYKFNFRKYITDLGLKHKSILQSNSCKSTLDKRKNTMIKIYGVDNASKNDEIKAKKKDTFLKHYGVDNIWKLREYRLWWESEMLKKYGKVCLADLYGNDNLWGWKNMTSLDKEKRITNLHNGFDKWYSNLSPEELETHIKNKIAHLSLSSYHKSSLEARIQNILIFNNIKFEAQKWISRYPFDFCFGNKILEVQGTYWHCDNRFYNENDIIKRNNEELLVSEIWEKDNFKKNIVESNGYKMFYIWEYDLNNMSDDDVLNFINKIINENN